jgi:hypothetical protein
MAKAEAMAAEQRRVYKAKIKTAPRQASRGVR